MKQMLWKQPDPGTASEHLKEHLGVVLKKTQAVVRGGQPVRG